MLTQVANGQSTIKGKITDSTNTPVPFTAVGVLNSNDSTVVKGTLSNDSGVYIFNTVKAGNYLLKVEATGYSVQFSQPFKTEGSGPVDMPVLQLKIELGIK